jgi:thiamine-monophosphate kinase
MSSEFSLIERYFFGTGVNQQTTILSQGDDAAVVEVPPGYQLVMSIDTLVAGVHFPELTTPADIAYKALAVNLSDLAAMAASPAWFLLSISMPENDERWLAEFSQGLKQLAREYQVELIGGDTCHGPLSITIQVNGLVKENRFVTRSRAQPGNLIVVSGQLGDAALGLADLQGKIDLPKALRMKCIDALNHPTPRLCLTSFLQNYATAAIDLSDGLVGDLRHILDKSAVGATIYKADLPVNQWIKDNNAFQYCLGGGDDYELCLTLPREHKNKLDNWNQRHPDCLLQVIGEITASDYILSDNGYWTDLKSTRGFQHFGK